VTINAQQQRIPLVGADNLITREWLNFLNRTLIATDEVASSTDADITALTGRVTALEALTAAQATQLASALAAIGVLQDQVADLLTRVRRLENVSDNSVAPALPALLRPAQDVAPRPGFAFDAPPDLVSLGDVRAELAALRARTQALEVGAY